MEKSHYDVLHELETLLSDSKTTFREWQELKSNIDKAYQCETREAILPRRHKSLDEFIADTKIGV